MNICIHLNYPHHPSIVSVNNSKLSLTCVLRDLRGQIASMQTSVAVILAHTHTCIYSAHTRLISIMWYSKLYISAAHGCFAWKFCPLHHAHWTEVTCEVILNGRKRHDRSTLRRFISFGWRAVFLSEAELRFDWTSPTPARPPSTRSLSMDFRRPNDKSTAWLWTPVHSPVGQNCRWEVEHLPLIKLFSKEDDLRTFTNIKYKIYCGASIPSNNRFIF